MTQDKRETIEAALKAFTETYTGRDLVELGALKAVDASASPVRVDIELPFPCAGYRDQLAQALRAHLAEAGVADADVQVSAQPPAVGARGGTGGLDSVKNIIAVASGKGGVGKSTVAVNLALALRAEGATVGILDADIYGPSQPRMLGITGRPSTTDGKTMQPLEGHGLQAMSIGFLIDEETPMVWRGPMVTQALNQLMTDTQWRDLDYLIIDLPPGTGDVQLSLAQNIPVSAAIIVSTPQDIALLDARRGLKMFQKVEVPVLGVVENMSTHICSNCGHEEAIFGSGGGKRLAEQHGIELLGQIPLDIRIREQTDSGRPSVVAEPDGEIAGRYRELARRAAARLAVGGRDVAAFPDIQVVDD